MMTRRERYAKSLEALNGLAVGEIATFGENTAKKLSNGQLRVTGRPGIDLPMTRSAEVLADWATGDCPGPWAAVVAAEKPAKITLKGREVSFMKSRYGGKCAHSGQAFDAGTEIVYHGPSRKAYLPEFVEVEPSVYPSK